MRLDPLPCVRQGANEFSLRNTAYDTSLYRGLCLGITTEPDVNSCNTVRCYVAYVIIQEKSIVGFLLTARKDLSISLKWMDVMIPDKYVWNSLMALKNTVIRAGNDGFFSA